MWMCMNTQHPLPRWWQPLLFGVIKDGGPDCTGCAPANEIWNRASEHVSKDWLIRGIYCESVNEVLAKSIFEEPYVSAEGVGGTTASRCLTDWAIQQAGFCESTLSGEQVQTHSTFPLVCNLPKYTETHMFLALSFLYFINCMQLLHYISWVINRSKPWLKEKPPQSDMNERQNKQVDPANNPPQRNAK